MKLSASIALSAHTPAQNKQRKLSHSHTSEEKYVLEEVWYE
jgi:hypothetical protein